MLSYTFSSNALYILTSFLQNITRTWIVGLELRNTLNMYLKMTGETQFVSDSLQLFWGCHEMSKKYEGACLSGTNTCLEKKHAGPHCFRYHCPTATTQRHAFNNKENHVTVTETARECSFESPSCSETNSNLKEWSQKGQELFLTPNCLYAVGKTRTSVNWTQAGIPRSTFWTRDHKEVWTPQHMSSGDSAAYYLPDSSTVQRPWAKDYIAKMITHFLWYNITSRCKLRQKKCTCWVTESARRQNLRAIKLVLTQQFLVSTEKGDHTGPASFLGMQDSSYAHPTGQ